jgi:hypothetical protein
VGPEVANIEKSVDAQGVGGLAGCSSRHCGCDRDVGSFS